MSSAFGIPASLPLKYTGPESAIIPLLPMPKRPTVNDKYPVCQFAILKKNPLNGTEGELWFLSHYSAAGVPQWRQIAVGAGAPGIDTITTDEGAPGIVPDAVGNVNLVGGTAIDITGQGPGNTGTVSARMATNAQTIAGTITNMVVAPSSLEAKLGALTHHGLAVGGGAGTAINWTAAGTTNSVCIGITGSDPVFSTTSTTYFNGIRFNNTNPGTLTWYEDVTNFTPYIVGTSSTGVGTYSVQHGRYVRIGLMVFVQINIEFSAHTGTGDMQIAGLPYSFGGAAVTNTMPAIVQYMPYPANTLWVCANGIDGVPRARLTASQNNGAASEVQMNASGGCIYVSGFYICA